MEEMYNPALSSSIVISSLNRSVFVRALRELSRTNPEAAELIGEKCRKHAAVTRFRAGVLYSSGGLAFDAAGLLTSSRRMPLYSIPEGQTDPVLGVMGLDDTNLEVGGKVQGSATFLAVARGWEVFIHRTSPTHAGLDAVVTAAGLLAQARATSFEDSLVGNDIQRSGIVSAFPAPSMYAQGVLGDLLAGAQGSTATIVGRGWGEIVPVNPLLEIGPDSTLRVTARANAPAFIAPPGGVLVVAMRHWFYGYELTQIRG